MKRVLGDMRTVWVLLAPALLVYTVVMLIPVFWSLGFSTMRGNALEGFQFVGVENLIQLTADPVVGESFLFTVKYAATVTVGQVLMGYVLSLIYLFVLKYSSALIRTLVFFPIVLPTVAVALMFQKMFEIAPQAGLVNSALNFFGFASIDWFGDSGLAFFVIALMDIWRSMGFYAVLLYTGLVDIPEEVLESAHLDGASGWRLVRHIVLPLSMPVLISSLIFSINGTLKVFDSIYALTGGGPGTSTSPLTLYMFQTSFSYGEYGYGSSIALLLTIMSLLVTLAVFRASRHDNTMEAVA